MLILIYFDLEMNLQALDLLLTLFHFVLIGFNLFGWIWPKTRKLHLICVVLTAASWLILGIWFGIGYCPITDWQWQIKEKLGEHDLPNSFIKYYADKISKEPLSVDLVDTLTAVCFAIAATLSVYLNIIRKKLKS